MIYRLKPLRHLDGYSFYHIIILIKSYSYYLKAGCTPCNQLGPNGTGMSKVDMMTIVPWHAAEYPGQGQEDQNLDKQRVFYNHLSFNGRGRPGYIYMYIYMDVLQASTTFNSPAEIAQGNGLPLPLCVTKRTRPKAPVPSVLPRLKSPTVSFSPRRGYWGSCRSVAFRTVNG